MKTNVNCIHPMITLEGYTKKEDPKKAILMANMANSDENTLTHYTMPLALRLG